MSISGFVGNAIDNLNNQRVTFYDASHTSHRGLGVQFASWSAHKVLSVVAFPVNLAGVAFGVTSMALSACTLGALKVAVYALTLGRIELRFSTGFISSGNVAVNSFLHLVRNTGELTIDVVNAIYNGYRVIRWIGEQLPLGFVREIFVQIGSLFRYVFNEVIVPSTEFLFRRLEVGFNSAVASEGNYQSNFQTPSFIRSLDDITASTRTDNHAQERSISQIFKHYLFSAANIPVNLATAVGMGALSLVTGSCFIAKIGICAFTTINIPLPTYVERTLEKTTVCSRNVFGDAYINVQDGFILTYKVSRAIHLTTVLATIGDLLLFIPRAVIS